MLPRNSSGYRRGKLIGPIRLRWAYLRYHMGIDILWRVSK